MQAYEHQFLPAIQRPEIRPLCVLRSALQWDGQVSWNWKLEAVAGRWATIGCSRGCA